jgi:hypothetical protein
VQIDGTVILEELGFEPDHFFMDIAVLVAFAIAFQALAYLSLKYFVRQQR